jgi:hypothetical protein
MQFCKIDELVFFYNPLLFDRVLVHENSRLTLIYLRSEIISGKGWTGWGDDGVAKL